MSEGLVVRELQRRRPRSCRHHWIIESPHGATSRGVCKRCGASRRFPNAAQDALWESTRSALGRFANRGAGRPTKITAPAGLEDDKL